jgi:hypothetical protein
VIVVLEGRFTVSNGSLFPVSLVVIVLPLEPVLNRAVNRLSGSEGEADAEGELEEEGEIL